MKKKTLKNKKQTNKPTKKKDKRKRKKERKHRSEIQYGNTNRNDIWVCVNIFSHIQFV